MATRVTSLQIKVLSDGVEKATKRLDRLERGGNRASRATDRLHNASKKVATSQRVARGALIATTGAMGALLLVTKQTVGAWLEFDKQAKEVRSITSLSAEQFSETRTEVLRLAAALGVDATDAAAGLYQAISAGVSQDQGIEFIKTASQTAVAGVTDIRTAVDGLTNVLNAYKIPADQAERVSDKLFTTVRLGKTTFAELSRSMATATVPASSLGIELDDLLASVIGITKQGTITSEAFTQVNSVITALINPSNELRDLFQRLGLGTARTAIEEKGFIQVLEILRKEVGDNDEALFALMRRKEAFAGILSLTGENADTVAEALEGLSESTGSMGRAYDVNADTLSNATARVKASFILLFEMLENNMGLISQVAAGFNLISGAIDQLTDGMPMSVRAIKDLGEGGFSLLADRIEGTRGRITELTEEIAKMPDGLVTADKMWEKVLAKRELKILERQLAGLIPLWDDLTDSQKANAKQQQLSAEASRILRNGNLSDEERKSWEAVLAGITESIRVRREEEKQVKATAQAKTEAAATAKKEASKQGEVLEALAKAELERTEKALEMASKLGTSDLERIQLKEQEIARLVELGKIDDDVAQAALNNLEDQKNAYLAAQDALLPEKGILDDAIAATERLAQTEMDRIEIKREQIRLALREGEVTQEIADKAMLALDQEVNALRKAEATKAAGELRDLQDFALEGVIEGLRTEEEAIRASYEERRAIILAATELTETQRQELMDRLQVQATKQLRDFETQRTLLLVSASEQLFDALAGAAREYAGEQSGIYKALFVMSKAFALAESVIKIQQGIAAAAALPWPANMPAIASVIAATSGVISTIASTSLVISAEQGGIVGGQSFSGDNVSARVNSGEMILTREQQGNLFKMANGQGGGGGGVNITVINTASGVEVETVEHPNENGSRDIELLIKKVDDQLASNLQSGRGAFTKAFDRRVPNRGRITQ